MKTEQTEKPFCVDRTSFMAWTQGTLLDRNRDGVCVVGDNTDHEKAVQLMDAGKTVSLTQNGKILTEMRLTDNGYEENVVPRR
ncbi:MAG: hypothetical protein DRJ03_02030 [Chloroflexi bacterium]|nr:MAG: hypothetical protein DRJ03_02030 [Chloroflexota bacterium]